MQAIDAQVKAYNARKLRDTGFVGGTGCFGGHRLHNEWAGSGPGTPPRDRDPDSCGCLAHLSRALAVSTGTLSYRNRK